MAALDWLSAAVLLISLLLGAWRGLVYELMAIAGWVCAFLVARWAGELVGFWLPMGDTPEPLRHVTGFVLVFIGVAFACGMLAALARRLATSLGLRPVDRVFGAVFGVLRAAMLLLVLAALVRMTPLAAAPWWRESLSGPLLEMTLQSILPFWPATAGPALSA